MIEITSQYLAEQGLSETFPQRFWEKVNKNGPVPQHMSHLGCCWVWTGCKIKDGYGQTWTGRRKVCAHVASWILHYGQIPEGLWVLHRCDFPSCVRPSHLFLGTRSDNLKDMIAKGRSLLGELNPNSKLTENQVEEIVRLRASGNLLKDIALAFGVNVSTVSHIAMAKGWRHITRAGE